MLYRPLHWLRRLSPNWRFTFVSISLLATMAVTGVAAYQLHASLRDHDESVERMLAEYARYTSRMFGEAVLRHGYGTRLDVMAAPRTIPAEAPGEAMALAEFVEHASRALRMHGIDDDEWLGFLRLELASGRFEAAGSATRAALAEAVDSVIRSELERTGPPETDALSRFVVHGEPLTLTFTVQRTRAGEPVAAFGYVVSRRNITDAQVRWVMERIPLYPPSMISPVTLYGDPVANDSLLSVEILDNLGTLLYRSPQRYRSPVQGEFTFRMEPGGFTIRSTLSPRVVEDIRALHRPDRSRHYALLLPFLSIILGTSAIVHLIRERELVRTRRNFVASVSHELRTPLAQIQLCAETLLRGRERSEEERHRWLGVIGREAYRMGGLVENILMFSHLERDELRLAREPTDLAELVHDVVDTFGPLAAARRTQLSAQIPVDIKADIDPRAVRQVLGNLIDNALKYGPEGQAVRITARPTSPDQICLAVTDQGPGVPPQEREAIWKPFRRLTHRNGSSGGSGLGLTVVASLIARHGGTASVDDAPGSGARFVVTLPLVPQTPTAPAAEPSPPLVPHPRKAAEPGPETVESFQSLE